MKNALIILIACQIPSNFQLLYMWNMFRIYHQNKNVYGYKKRGTSLFFMLLHFLLSVDSSIPEHYNDTNHFSIRCFLIELCGKLAAIPVYRKSENERR